MKQLERDASTGNPAAIRKLCKARGVEGRDPALYPWAGDKWRRMHWSILVLDPCVIQKEKRFVKVSEGFVAKNERGAAEPTRDNTGRRVPAVQKMMPWAEWLWWTSSGGFPKPMRPYQKNNTPAGCLYKVPSTQIASPPPPTPVPPPPPPAAKKV